MKAIQIEVFGNPAEVVKAVDVPDVGAPAAGEVVIAVEASPINQYDLLLIAGDYGYRPRLPAIMGTEGVGRVVAVGAGVKHASASNARRNAFIPIAIYSTKWSGPRLLSGAPVTPKSLMSWPRGPSMKGKKT
jgi:Zn-dependent alcohol dehydrogenase